MSHGNCDSCGMPVEHGPYCHYCVDESGQLQGFDETVRRMSAFWRGRNPSLTEADAERQTLQHMATMPAWKEHPELAARFRR